ncbi:SDR family NAD(P)-dependent oxidoreductase [Brachybacterium alimentarium]|uniref:SDR family NAD(P)-dependent oxidoreductase n=1 Tax=Brachybacterium alimentarium TaxID=47845 RepID=UPI003FCF953C
MAHTILPLTEQIVLVTGGARGLRAAITRAFLAQGARVVIDYHTSQDAAEDLAAAHPGKAIAIRADVRDRAQVDALVAEAADRFGGPITTVVNNALADFSFNGDARGDVKASKQHGARRRAVERMPRWA